MKVFQDVSEWRGFRARLNQDLGFVPTMGALHAGHASLVERSRAENAATLVSIFVNPTQFDDPADLDKYPQTLEADLERLQELGTDYVLAPTAASVYPSGYRFRVQEQEVSRLLCGRHRPGHFDGMLTVVLKLLGLARARRAYFGEKDFQQLELVRDMAADFFLDTEIIGCPTMREPDGVAMSSRNVRLSAPARLQAAQFAARLQDTADPAELRQKLEEAGLAVDYVENWRGRRLAAVRLDQGTVRLIDNVSLEG